MEHYSLDPGGISMDRFLELTLSRKPVPGRAALHERIGERFNILASRGIGHLGQLIAMLGDREKRAALALETGIPEAYLVLLKREAGSYLSRPYPLSDLPGIPYEFTEVLLTRKIKNTREFYEKVQTGARRQEVSAWSGIPADRLKEIFSLCELCRITGVGPRFARVLYDSGIRSLKAFAETGAGPLLKKCLETMEKSGHQKQNLGEDDLQYCIDYARIILELT
jgi:hypothetical protein